MASKRKTTKPNPRKAKAAKLAAAFRAATIAVRSKDSRDMLPKVEW